MSAPRKLKTTEVLKVRTALVKHQGHKCDICRRKFSSKVVPCLDHDHATGYIRGAICRACNRLEGQVKNRVIMAGGSDDPVKLLGSLVAYWEKHRTPQFNYLHPTFKTEAEKRLERNKKAREKRAAMKAK